VGGTAEGAHWAAEPHVAVLPINSVALSGEREPHEGPFRVRRGHGTEHERQLRHPLYAGNPAPVLVSLDGTQDRGEPPWRLREVLPAGAVTASGQTSSTTFRKAAEQSQAQLGTHTRYDRTSINKIEYGHQLPDRPFWQVVDKPLHADGALLKRYDELVASKREHAQRQRQSSRARHQADAARLRGERAMTSAPLNSDATNKPTDDPEHDAVLSAPWSHRGTVGASIVLRGGGSRVQRRHFVFLSGAALTAPAHQWLVHEPGPLVSGLSGRRVSSGLTDRLTAMISKLRKMDDVAGGVSVLALAQQEFEWVAGLLDRALYDERTGRTLRIALAELGQLCGWAAYPAGQHALAQRYYVAALHATHSADDRPLGAHVLSFMAEQAARQGQPAEAVTLIQTALAGTRGRQTPSLLANLYTGQAYAFATLGDASGCTAALSQARTQIERLTPPAEPSWPISVFVLSRTRINKRSIPPPGG